MAQGPVRIELPDGSVVASDRLIVAICACRRSQIYPLRDTSHRRRCRARCVSSAVGVATSDQSSSTPYPTLVVHRVQPAVSVESLRRLSAVSLRTSGSTTRCCSTWSGWAHTNGFVPQSLSSDGRSGGQRGGADRRLCPARRPLRFWPIGASGWASVRRGL